MPNVAEKIVLDLETKKSFDQVRERKPKLLGVSVVGIYSYRDDQFKVFLEKDIKKLLPYLEQAELIIGFNIKRFDYSVLQPYLDLDLQRLNSLDILEEIHNSLGFRIGLNSIAQATLQIRKKGCGLDALKYFRQGEMDKLTQYCQHDVFITREVYEYGKRFGHLLFRRSLGLETIPISWAECKTIDAITQEAFDKRKTLEIEYSSPNNKAGKRHTRQIDIYNFDFGRIIAYCHLRCDLRTFNIRRVLSAKLAEGTYEIPGDFNLEEFKKRQKFFFGKKET